MVGLPVYQALVGEVAGAVQEKDDLAFGKNKSDKLYSQIHRQVYWLTGS